MMATDSSAARPKEVWDKLYIESKDVWTKKAVACEILKFYDVITNGKENLKVLFPLCGKTEALLYFAEKGHRVVGIEWSEVAVKMFFQENNLSYSCQTRNISGTDIPVFTANDKDITIYCANIFSFENENLGGFDCIYNYGSVDSISKDDHAKYANIMAAFTKPGGRMLLSIFDYDYSEHPFPPFAVTQEEVISLYSSSFEIPKVLQELDASKTAEIFELTPDGVFPVMTFSRMSWKVLLLILYN